MEIFGPFLLSLIAGLSTCIGYLFTLFPIKNKDKFLCISLSFASSVMILISFKELIPIPSNFILNYFNIYQALSILIIIPIIVILILKILNKGIKNNNSLYRVGVLSMISLLLHNIPEGIVTFISTISNFKLGLKLSIAIMAHNIPEGIAISIPIYYSTKSRGKAFLYTFIAGFAEPLGALLVYLFLKNYISIPLLNIMLYFIGCLMILICYKEIIPEIKKYHNKLWILYGITLSLFILFI